MLNELKELLLGLGAALGLLIGFVWVRAFILGRAHAKNERASSPAEKNTDKNLHQAFEALLDSDTLPPIQIIPRDKAKVRKMFIATKAGEKMQRVKNINVLANRGIEHDRYCNGSGYWSDTDKCEVTLIAHEDLEHIESSTGIKIHDGEHRRNIVSQNLNFQSLVGKRFKIGSAYFSYQRPRPPCLYIQKLTEPGMVKALAHCGGICVRCFRSGTIHENDEIVLLEISVLAALKHRCKSLIRLIRN